MAYETRYRPCIFVQIVPGVTRCKFGWFPVYGSSRLRNRRIHSVVVEILYLDTFQGRLNVNVYTKIKM